jgi:hypothetical protein
MEGNIELAKMERFSKLGKFHRAINEGGARCSLIPEGSKGSTVFKYRHSNSGVISLDVCNLTGATRVHTSN